MHLCSGISFRLLVNIIQFEVAHASFHISIAMLMLMPMKLQSNANIHKESCGYELPNIFAYASSTSLAISSNVTMTIW